LPGATALGKILKIQKEDSCMKKLLSILFAAMIGLSLSMATFAQEQPKEETKKSETKKKGTKKHKGEKKKEEEKKEEKK
jgi:uncharacterized protein HemX